MEKSCNSSADSSSINNNNNNNNNNNTSTTTTTTSTTRPLNPSDHFLKHLNKISHKISKPISRRSSSPSPSLLLDQNPPSDHHFKQNPDLQIHQQQTQTQVPPPPPPLHQNPQHQQQQQQQQPPVYNINKSDFRDVVQKLTGSPAHDHRFSTPPPIQPPKPPSSRLQRIRPPPLAHVSNRPPSPLNNTFISHQQPLQPSNTNTNPNHHFNGRNQITPLSPLPPFPTVHASAESPISAYMRYLQSSNPNLDSESKKFGGFSTMGHVMSPKWSNNPSSFHHQQFQHHQNQQIVVNSPTAAMGPNSNSQFMMPNSPLAFGRIASPRSPYPLLSPSLLFPSSPRLQILSPRWRGH